MVNQPDLPNTAVLAVSRDAEFVASLTVALQGSRELLHAPDMATAEDMVIAHNVGVVVTDRGTSQEEIKSIAGRLRPIVPQLVFVVAGDRSHANDMMDLITSGDIYRFLLTPLAPGQTRVCIESAISRFNTIAEDGPAAAIPETERESSPVPWLLAAAGVVVALAAGAWWFVGKDEPQAPPAQVAQPAPPSPPQEATSEQPGQSRDAAVDRSLSMAREALANGRLVEPIGANALYFFRSVLKAEPDNAEALEGMRTIAANLIERTTEAVESGDLDAARSSLAIVRSITPDDPAIAELQQRIGVQDATAAIASAQQLALSQDFTGALALLAEQPDSAEIVAARTSIQDAQRAARVEASLQQMAVGIATGDLLEPAGRSAHFHAMAAMALAPNSPEVRTAVTGLGDLLIEQASTATTAGSFDESEQWLAAAEALGVVGAAVSDARVANLDAIAAQEAAQVVDAANAERLSFAAERIASSQLLDPPDDSAFFYLSEVRSSDPANGDLPAAEQQLAGALLLSASQAIEGQQYAEATRLVDAAASLGADASAVAAERSAIETALAAQAAAEQQPEFISTRELTRTRYVAPNYPLIAERRDVEGSVLLEFTLTVEGLVRDIEIIESEPRKVFDRSATTALARWEFEPYEVAGEPQEVRVRVDMSFVLN
ncbi:MAG: TonB family protein [Pseudomonadota bacterium]